MKYIKKPIPVEAFQYIDCVIDIPSNIQLELETIGKYLKVLCEIQIKNNKDTK